MRAYSWLCLLFVVAGPACGGERVEVVVYDAPRMFFSSPEHAPTLGSAVSALAPDRPAFQSDPGGRFALALDALLQERAKDGLRMPAETIAGPSRTSKIVNPVGSRHLIVFTTMNFLGYRAFGWRTYQYGYAAYLRLVDADGATTLETSCMVSANKSNPSLQLKRDELQVPGRFDGVVDHAVRLCAEQVAGEIADAL